MSKSTGPPAATAVTGTGVEAGAVAISLVAGFAAIAVGLAVGAAAAMVGLPAIGVEEGLEVVEGVEAEFAAHAARASAIELRRSGDTRVEIFMTTDRVENKRLAEDRLRKDYGLKSLILGGQKHHGGIRQKNSSTPRFARAR
jgi:hypothetical protein